MPIAARPGRSASSGEMSPFIPQAVMAIEDRRFYSHFGIDPLGLARAIVTNVVSGRAVQGGSTLTQQLAKTSFCPRSAPSSARCRKSARLLAGAEIHQGSDPRDVSEPGLFWLERLWRGSRRTSLFQQIGARCESRGSRSSRRIAESAVETLSRRDPEAAEAVPRSCSRPCWKRVI